MYSVYLCDLIQRSVIDITRIKRECSCASFGSIVYSSNVFRILQVGD